MMAVKSKGFGSERHTYNLSSQANLDHSCRGEPSKQSKPVDTFAR